MKSFLNFKKDSSLTMTRNGVTFSFISTNMEKGSQGVYPGVDTKKFNLEEFISFRAKNIETAKDPTLRLMSFSSFVVDAINDIAMATWKTCVKSTEVEYDAKDKATAKPEVIVTDDAYSAFVKAFEDTLDGLFNGETKQRERNSVYYAKQVETLTKLMSKEKDKEKKASLRLQVIEAQRTSKTLREAEEKAMDNAVKDAIDDLIDDLSDFTDEVDDDNEVEDKE